MRGRFLFVSHLEALIKSKKFIFKRDDMRVLNELIVLLPFVKDFNTI